MARQAGGPQLPAGRATLLETPGDHAQSVPLRDVSGRRFGEVSLAKRRELSRWRRFGRFWDVLRCDQKRLSTCGNRVLGCGATFY